VKKYFGKVTGVVVVTLLFICTDALFYSLMVHFPKLSVSENRVKRGKAIPTQFWTGLEGSRRLRLLYFMTIGT
jgi:hypothetical protein